MLWCTIPSGTHRAHHNILCTTYWGVLRLWHNPGVPQYVVPRLKTQTPGRRLIVDSSMCLNRSNKGGGRRIAGCRAGRIVGLREGCLWNPCRINNMARQRLCFLVGRGGVARELMGIKYPFLSTKYLSHLEKKV